MTNLTFDSIAQLYHLRSKCSIIYTYTLISNGNSIAIVQCCIEPCSGTTFPSSRNWKQWNFGMLAKNGGTLRSYDSLIFTSRYHISTWQKAVRKGFIYQIFFRVFSKVGRTFTAAQIVSDIMYSLITPIPSSVLRNLTPWSPRQAGSSGLSPHWCIVSYLSLDTFLWLFRHKINCLTFFIHPFIPEPFPWGIPWGFILTSTLRWQNIPSF